MDYLAQQMKKRQKRGPGRLLLVLKQSPSTPLPSHIEVLQGVGGTTVYRTRLGARVTESGER